MINFYFFPNSILMVLFIFSSIAIAFQATYVWTLFFNSLKSKKYEFVTELFLTVYLIFLARSPIFAMVNRYTSVVDIQAGVDFHYLVSAPTLLFFLYLIIVKSVKYILPFVLIILSLPYMGNTDLFIYFYGISIFGFFFRGLTYSVKELRLKNREVSAFTIKQGMDTLSAGVLFASADGHTFLVNTCMLELMERFFDREQLNAKIFWEDILAGKAKDAMTQLLLSTVLIRTHCTSWSFIRREFKVGKQIFVEIIATDVTEVDSSFLALEKDSKTLLEQNEEIRMLSENMIKLREEQEFSRIRSQIHDVMGQRLTAIQRLLHSQKTSDYGDIIPLLQNIVENIQEEKSKDMGHMLLELCLYFKKIGITIKIDGELPNDEDIAYLFITTLREATTNASRHAGSSIVYATIKETKNKYEFIITNNGKKPTEAGIIGGGLSGIQMRVETAGGSICFDWIPRFVISIVMEKKHKKRGKSK